MALKFRRGTTAQQSGSLAFGEPYVNTTLGTLLIGGPNGDIVLSATGTGSTGNFGPISGSGLDITGDANIHGNLTLGGNITIGNATTDNVVINADLSSSLIPNDDNAFDIGSPTKRYRDIYGNKVSASVIEITNGYAAELKLTNTAVGYGYHLQNTPDGNFSVHNSVTNTSIFRIDSGSIQHAHLFGDLFVSGNVAAGESMIAQRITGSLSGSVSGIGNVSAYSSSVNSRLSTLETETSNLESFTSSINTTIKSKLDADGVISGSSQITISDTTGYTAFSSSLDSRISTEKGKVDAILLAADADKDSFAEIVTLINSVDTTNDNAFASFYTASVGRLSNLESTSASVNVSVSNLNTYTGSNDTTNTTQNSRLDQLSTASGSAITRLTALEVETANLEAFTSSINTTIKSKLDADGVISSSAQLTTTFDSRYLNTNGDGVVSGSSQIAFSGVTGTVSNAQLANSTISGISLGSNLATLTIGSGLSGTSYNGSGAVTIANTGVLSNVAGTGVSVSGATGNVTISIGQSVATSASPTFAGLTINGAITATGDITAFFTSDKRHKNNIQIIPNALEKVSKLNGVTWEWNDDVNEVTKQSPKTGLIAQEVLEVLPEVVKQKEDGFLGLDYSKMIGLLVEAIKEQQSQIEELKTKLGYN